MKLLYLAGPFSAPAGDSDPLHTVRANILVASRIALEAARAGWMPVCPHKNSSGFEHTEIPAAFWYEGDIALMLRCDAVLMLPGWTASKGAVREFFMAQPRRIPIFVYANGMPTPEDAATRITQDAPIDVPAGINVALSHSPDHQAIDGDKLVWWLDGARDDPHADRKEPIRITAQRIADAVRSGVFDLPEGS